MYLAALKSVPEQLYEAADIDGANAWQKFVHITLPMMRNIIAITVLFSLIVTFANFDIVQIMTAGGPRNMTHMFATYAFLLGIRSGDLPLGAATSLFMLPILAVAAVSSCAACANAGGRSGEHRHSRRAGGKTRRLDQPAAQPALGVVCVLFFLILFAIFFLMPPYYMVVTALKSDAEMARHGDQSVVHLRRRHARSVQASVTQTDFLIFSRTTSS
jgi:ABC-type sugar transport system permease subunit